MQRGFDFHVAHIFVSSARITRDAGPSAKIQSCFLHLLWWSVKNFHGAGLVTSIISRIVRPEYLDYKKKK